MDAKEFKEAIENIVDAKINKQGMTKFISAIIHSVNQNGTINVYLPPDEEKIVTGLLNKTGQNLNPNDSVELCTKNGKIKNAWVAIRHGDNFVADGGGGGSVSESSPIGTIVQFPGDNIPAGWLMCDGAEISRRTYATLFSKIGTTYGSGDGSTTFNLPNFNGKVPVGLDTEDSDFDELGETGGEKNHLLTIAEIPSHTHNVGAGAYGEAVVETTINYNSSTSHRHGDSAGRVAEGPSGGSNGAYKLYTYATGGGNSHNNLQPYIVVQFIIKAINVEAEEDKFIDVMPINSIIEYDGNTVPSGYEEVSEMSGSNENGSWVKFADGTMICCQKISTGQCSVSSAWGSLYAYSNTNTYNFPQTFTDIPTISIESGNITGSYGFWLADYGNRVVTNSYWKGWALIRPTSGTVNTVLNIIAMGRWK